MTVPDSHELLARGRAALAAHEWRSAFETLTAADTAGGLDSEGLNLLASASWWTGQLPAAIEARERAYAAATRQGDTSAAALAAIFLARDNLLRLATSVAAGWLSRAERLLAELPDSPAHGWLAVMRAFHATLTGDQAEALVQATRALELGRRFGVRDLEVFGLSEKGAILLTLGQVEEGLALADEATAAAVSGELDPETAGGVTCATIESCAGIGDVRRAAEWIEAQDRWCRREGINGYPGMCRLFRSDIKRLRGAWPEAEAEALVATDELLGFIPAAAGVAWYQIGEIRLRRGDLPAAEEALLAGHARGQDPQPMLSLLRLAQGRVEEAAAAIRRAIDEPSQAPSWMASPNSPVARLALLPAAVEVLLAAGDAAGARRAADELTQLSDQFRTASARASAASADGAVTLAEGAVEVAAQQLRDAAQLWAEVDAPYELARTRLVLADAYRRDNAADRAILEIRAARAAFEALGARLDLQRADELLEELRASGQTLPTGMATTRVVRTFMFTDIVDSTRLAESLGDAEWDTVLRAHDRVIRSSAAEHGGIEVKATGDGFFLSFADADGAIQAAIGMQRLLTQGVGDGRPALPAVRIGIHRAEANRVGLDYVGSGVNQAARIGAAAGGGEILVSTVTLTDVRREVPTSDRRSLTLKGIGQPVEVASVDWR